MIKSQFVDIPLTGGVDQHRSDKTTLKLPFLKNAENLVVFKEGELINDEDFRKIGKVAGGKHILSIKDVLFSITPTDINIALEFREGEDSFVSAGSFRTFEIERISLIQDIVSVINVSSVVSLDGKNLDIIYQTSDNKVYLIRDALNRSNPKELVMETTEDTPLFLFRRFHNEEHGLYVVFKEGENLRMKHIEEGGELRTLEVFSTSIKSFIARKNDQDIFEIGILLDTGAELQVNLDEQDLVSSIVNVPSQGPGRLYAYPKEKFSNVSAYPWEIFEAGTGFARDTYLFWVEESGHFLADQGDISYKDLNKDRVCAKFNSENAIVEPERIPSFMGEHLRLSLGISRVITIPIVSASRLRDVDGNLRQVYSLDVVNIKEIDNELRKPTVITHKESSIISGSLLRYFDGKNLVEFGFSQVPRLGEVEDEQ